MGNFLEKKHNSCLTSTARKLRKEMTPQEKRLWYDFFKGCNYRILKQKIIGRFIVDFYCAAAKLAIEIDGSQHLTEEGIVKDEERTEILKLYGIAAIRFSNYEVDTDFEAVCNKIDQLVKQRSQTALE